MDHLRDIEIFLEVAEAGSFAVAARKLGLSRAAVTTHVARLEARLGVQLLTRRSRSVSPTDAGVNLTRQASPLLSQLDTIMGELQATTRGMEGPIRIGVPPVCALQVLAPAAATFLALHPNIQISLIHDDGRSTLTTEGLDFSIRLVHELESTSETRWYFGRVAQEIVASSAYLARHGTPATPDDLRDHNCLTPDLGKPSHPWRFQGPGGECAVHVTGSMKANMAECVRTAAVMGLGIVLQPRYVLKPFLADAQLVPLLPDYRPLPLNAYAIYGGSPARLPHRVRAFLEFLKIWDGAHDVIERPAAMAS